MVKQWLVALTTVGFLSTGGSAVYAADGLHGHDLPGSTRASVRPVAVSVTDVDHGAPNIHHFDVKSSVQVSRDTIRDAYMASLDAYTKKLQVYAKCSSRDAQKTVATAHPGMKVEELRLRNIRTNLVYMAIADDDEDRFLVIVDAGNGKVLLDRRLDTHQEKAFAQH